MLITGLSLITPVNQGFYGDVSTTTDERSVFGASGTTTLMGGVHVSTRK
jgi:hypothetical protein